MNEIITLKRFADIGLNDTFFNSLKEDYPGFDAWFEKKSKDNSEAYIIGKTNRDEIQNQMRLKFARKLQKRNVTEKSRTSYSQKWLSNVN